MSISKELLSEVLGRQVALDGNIQIANTVVHYSDTTHMSSINIYELVHRCKKWARTLKFIYMNIGNPLSETRSGLDIRISIKQLYGKPFGVEIVTLDERFSILSYLKHETFDTEQDAVVKACEWILKNKDTK